MNLVTGHSNQDYLVLVQAAGSDDSAALDVMDKIGYFFGNGLTSLINIFNPRYILLGGSLCDGSQFFMPSVMSEIDQHCFKIIRNNLEEVQVVDHPNESAVLGAVSLVIKEVLASPSRWYTNGNSEGRRIG